MKEYFHLDLFAESTGLNRDGLMLAAEWWVEFDYEPEDPSVGMAETIYINEVGCNGLAGDTLIEFQQWMAGQESQIEGLIWERIAEEREKAAAMLDEYKQQEYEDRIMRGAFGL